MTSQKKPNVLVLTADTFRADRTSLHGYNRPTTPNLENLGNESIVCDNAVTLGPFTQIACIQLFTSSRPLSYGGYDRGAAGRPTTLFQHFKNAGYTTWGLSTIHWVSPYYGYTGGLDNEYSVFHLNTIPGMAMMNMRDTLHLYGEKKIGSDLLLSRTVPVIEKMFANIIDYCTYLETRMPEFKSSFRTAKLVNDDYNFTKVRAICSQHERAFRANPLGYIEQNLIPIPALHEWLPREWKFARTLQKLVKEALFRLSNQALSLIAPDQARQRASKIRMAVDAHAIADKVVEQINNADETKPFFVWAHFKDSHQPYVAGAGPGWQQQTKSYLEQLAYSPDIDPSLVFDRLDVRDSDAVSKVSALYDCSVLSTDVAIGRILNALKEKGLYDDTVIAFCGDHGEEIGEHGDYGHLCMGYDHNAHIPMLFHPAGGGGARTDALVTSLDWSPTLTHLAGLEADPGWEGSPVTSNNVKNRNHIVLENFCRGDCIFDHRPLYMGIRTKENNYLWREYVDVHHKVGSAEPELYDLRSDPKEENNIYDPDHPLVDGFNELIAERLRAIPEVQNERIAKAFPTRPKVAS